MTYSHVPGRMPEILMSKREAVCIPQEEIVRQREFLHQVRYMNRGIPKKYSISTFGCQMNENDSERLSGMLAEMGYEETDRQEESDFIIFNTCCVRENAELKVYGHLGRLKKLKEEKPELLIAVCGCMMQQSDVVDHIKKSYRHVDLVFGTHNLFRFPELTYTAMMEKAPVIAVSEEEGTIAEGLPIERKDGVKAWVTIMYGCNNFCSYCIVPYVRGRERSRIKEDILDEIRLLGHQGYKEVTLLGQNVNSYGKDREDGIDFSRLLHEVNAVEGIERIRFMTSHPKDLSDDLIRAMKECPKVCEHLHLPIQSGSNRILKEMNRKYTREHYLELVSKIREAMPGIALTTDIIVGFPGETEEDFLDTLDLMKKVRFDTAYTFLYSVRKGTPAAEKTDRVPEEVKKERFDRLLALQNAVSRQINDPLLGAELEVLVEGVSRNNIHTFSGRTRTNKIVNFNGNSGLIGRLVRVRIEKVQTWSLEGTLISG